MALTHKVGVVYSSDAGTITNTTDTYTADGESQYDGTIATGVTHGEIDIAVDVSAIKSMVMYSTQALTVKTNSTSAPDDTISLAASKQLVWTIDRLEACPLTADVTKFYVTNASGSSATVKFRFLVDVTP
jgi:hypothetical protein